MEIVFNTTPFFTVNPSLYFINIPRSNFGFPYLRNESSQVLGHLVYYIINSYFVQYAITFLSA